MTAVRWTVAFVECPWKILWFVTTIHSAINWASADCQVPLRRQCPIGRLPHAVASREQQLKQQHFASRPMSAPNSCLLLSMLSTHDPVHYLCVFSGVWRHVVRDLDTTTLHLTKLPQQLPQLDGLSLDDSRQRRLPSCAQRHRLSLGA